MEAARAHLVHSLEWKGERLGVVEMRRHYANYFRGLAHFKQHRFVLVTEEESSRTSLPNSTRWPRPIADGISNA